MIDDKLKQELKENGVVIMNTGRDKTTGRVDIIIKFLFNLNKRQQKFVEDTFGTKVWPKGYKTMKMNNFGFKAGTCTTITYLKTKV